MKKVILVDGYYERSEGGLIQGVKGNYTPPGAIRGGNGSFIMSSTPSRAMIEVKEVDGEWKQTFNIGYQLKRHFDLKRLTRKRSEDAFRKLAISPFEVQRNNRGYWEICDLDEIYKRRP